MVEAGIVKKLVASVPIVYSEADPAPEAPKKKYGIVAVSNGEGISNLFRDLGCDEIVEGGQTNNPSTNDFIDAFDKINAESIFVFPNNGNIIMAAGQAAEIYEKAKIYVIPTKSIGAGYVAMSSMWCKYPRNVRSGYRKAGRPCGYTH